MFSRRQGDLFSALGDGTRRALFERLAGGEATVTALVARSGVSQPAVSQHLRVLRRCGLVAHRQEGGSRGYRARVEGLEPLMYWMAHYKAFWPERLEKMKAVLNEMDEK